MDRNIKDSNIFFQFKDIVRFLLNANIIEKCIIVTQCHSFSGYSGFESDSKVSKDLFAYLQAANISPVELFDKPFSPEELLRIYGGARYSISIRLHAAIFSLISGTPAIAISYWSYKTAGIMKMLGMQDSLIEADADARGIVRKIEEIEKDYMKEVQDISQRVKKLHDEALNTPLLLKELLNN
jgi:polysaccharide pyruvyl transferase WcaK-like protein